MYKLGTRWKAFLLASVLVSCLIGILIELKLAAKEYEHVDFISEITQEDCFLCTELTSHEDNVGILNLNTFELLRLEICRYDGYGNPIREPAGVMLSGGMGSDGTYAHTFIFPDNGYATVQITGTTYAIDRDTIQSHLCQTCLDSINSLWFGGCPSAEFAVVSYEARTLRPLIENCTWFSSGNYGVNCEFRENGDIRLLVHYLAQPYT